MRVWILQTGEPLHVDGDNPRPMRAMNLADALVAHGHDVTLWSSDFYHQKRIHRTGRETTIDVSGRLRIHLVPSPGYRRNIGIGRLFDHAVLAGRLRRMLNAETLLPDVAFVGYPPIETAAVMTRWLKARKVPMMIDAKDQWPTIFVEPLPAWLRPAGRLVLAPYFRLARRSMADADAFCSMSDAFVDWMCEVAGRPRRAADIAIPLSAPRLPVDDRALQVALGWWAEQGVSTNHRRRLCFVGSLSPAFDFSIVRSLAEKCLVNGVDCQFVICGDGGAAHDVRRLMAGLDNVIMPGWIDAPRIAALASCSAASIAPYINNDAYMRSIPNKIVDSLANGLPVLTTLRGTVADLVTTEGIGYSGDSPEEMFSFLCRLLGDEAFRADMATVASACYDHRFSADEVYGRLAAALERLAMQ